MSGCSQVSDETALNNLFDAILENDPVVARKIIVRHSNIISDDETIGAELLCDAIESCPDVIDDLIAAGAQINEQSSLGSTPLEAAAFKLTDISLPASEVRYDLVKKLLNLGADPKRPFVTVAAALNGEESEDIREIYERILELLAQHGGYLETAETLSVCPDNTPLVDTEVLQDFYGLDAEFDLDQETFKRIESGELVLADSTFPAHQPFSRTSRWHFEVKKEEWQRRDATLDGFVRPFPKTITSLDLPNTPNSRVEYRQVLKHGKITSHEVCYQPGNVPAADFFNDILDQLARQNIFLHDEIVDGEAVADLDDDWKIDVWFFGSDEYANVQLTLKVKRK
ncbi:hypothetical protein ACFL2H_10635 [Planctomycetota bacterium]